MEFLSSEELTKIHEALVNHFANQSDPISPPGVRSHSLLESALSRQYCGFDGRYKYPNPNNNAATLLYGLCMDHPFHNGNKRTALVATLVHLEKNHRIPTRVSHDEFYDLVLNLAKHTVHEFCRTEARSILKDKRDPISPTSDEEVLIIGKWLEYRTRPVKLSEHPITFRQLRRILLGFKCEIGPPKSSFINITRIIEIPQKVWFLNRTKKETLKTQIAYAGEGTTLGVDTIKKVRRDLKLDSDGGIDSEIFYETQEITDRLLNQYQKLLKRLARI